MDDNATPPPVPPVPVAAKAPVPPAPAVVLAAAPAPAAVPEFIVPLDEALAAISATMHAVELLGAFAADERRLGHHHDTVSNFRLRLVEFGARPSA